MFKSKTKDILYTPVNPFYYVNVKMGVKGVFITRMCKHDDIYSCLRNDIVCIVAALIVCTRI